MFSRRDVLAASGALVFESQAGLTARLPGMVTPKSVTPTVLATGGDFPGTPGRPYFGRMLLSLLAKPDPTICYIGDAGGDWPEDLASFKQDMSSLPFRIVSFDIFKPATLNFLDFLMGVDAVFVGGGSTRNLMALWKEWGFDKALVEAWKAGVVMSGASAGALCWYETGLTDSYRPTLSSVGGLGILSGSADVHHEVRPDRAVKFREMIADGSLKSPGLALDETVAAVYRGTRLTELVSVTKEGKASLVVKTPSGYNERQLPVRYLG
ncbi:Type 1 glutamine amidotransferase-like domain-containing protein [Sphingomonas sp. CARO-RG-8B-R24-01]|uniref:Type 1 glutamine amidotransferase-like domain-containing protein n=1 Tax=Sphingomonas sp. CARO-RG-8B-R24-01 TaxID=2914831 RepID=UPI001F597D31|nr:Type 1 glutamine amidotransferase-like domain-containing protein [Sphingomonas sp. CARO-RG-8B-R24-01]